MPALTGTLAAGRPEKHLRCARPNMLAFCFTLRRSMFRCGKCAWRPSEMDFTQRHALHMHHCPGASRAAYAVEVTFVLMLSMASRTKSG